MERRPGGLTALAVFNFIWAFASALGAIGILFLMGNPEAADGAFDEISTGEALAMAGATGLSAVLLVVSGFGYLKCHRILGFWGGMAYVVSGFMVLAIRAFAIGRMDVEFVQDAVHPTLTAVLLLTVFRRDLLGATSKSTVPPPADTVPEQASRPAAHVGLIARFSIRYVMRNGSGVLFLILVLVVGVEAAGDLLKSLESDLDDRGKSALSVVETIVQSSVVRNTIEGMVDADPEQVDFLLDDRPALLSAFLLILLVMTPFSSCLGGFNQTASDIGTRGLRYLLLRTERKNVLLGRYVGTLVFTSTSMLFLLVVFGLYVQIGLGAYGAELWTWGLEGFLAVFLLALPHLALCAWVSGACNGAFVSLAVCLMSIALPLVLIKTSISALEVGVDVDIRWIEKLLPWGWKYELLSHDIGERILASLVMCGFTLLFMFLGLRHFGRRDL